MSESDISMEDLLSTVLAEGSSELCLAVDRQPSLGIDGQTHVFDVAAVNAEKMDALFQSVASPAQAQKLRANGSVEFICDFETTKFKRHASGRFRVKAKAADGRAVLLKCHSLPLEPG